MLLYVGKVSVWPTLTVITIDVVALFFVGLRLRGVVGSLLVVQAVYWGLGYIARPVALLTFNPAPQLGDPLADVRLASAGYERTIAAALSPTVFGMTLYVGLMTLVVLVVRRRAVAGTTRFELALAHGFVLFSLGWTFRVVYLVLRDNLTLTLSAIAAIAAGGIILFARKPFTPVVIAALGGSELIWSVLTQSKTPFLALALWVLIRLISRGGITWRVAGIGAVALGVFFFIQDLRVDAGRLQNTESYASAYPLWVRPMLPLIARFDALQSSADAWFAGPASWMPPLEATGQWLTSLLPQFLLPDAKPLAGAQWGEEVRRMSLNVTPGAALAEGPFAEGWVIAGWPGVAFGASFMALAVIVIAALLTARNTAAALLGLAMTSAPLLFERGVLAFGEGLGKGLQTTIVAGAVLFLLRMKTSRGKPRGIVATRGRGSRPLGAPDARLPGVSRRDREE
ncbi:hypothetical protein [Microbacterium sp. BDGP8]|uniref:hypothetical protein n=1 Tax=Microbacterium sp. BDGP8 TaxID=3035531 RepID=UPI00249E5162|nr:hypothetical protein [Microbacterium sp. BDGP8]WHE35757.1 hypothetical protein P6897_13855 [Microbacterium sp. BDGP8]